MASRGLVWKDLSPEEMASVTAEADPTAKVEMLCRVLQLNHYADNARSAILADFCLYNLTFCEENGFSAEKSSALFSILRTTFEHSFEGPVPVSMQESLAFFKERMLEHSVESPPERVGVFTLQEVRLVTDYIGKSFYRHYKAHQYCFSRRQPVVQSKRVLTVETPPVPPPLASATVLS
mmetsp:Transcript_13051/g.22980  ORF Transcript_13051/g.22980 Transcript_13051/m.22980 type:complete len:179 (+) Transcript_13051:143-679(+)